MGNFILNIGNAHPYIVHTVKYSQDFLKLHQLLVARVAAVERFYLDSILYVKTEILGRIVHYHCPFEIDTLVNLAQVLDWHALNDRAVISVEPATDVPVDVDIV